MCAGAKKKGNEKILTMKELEGILEAVSKEKLTPEEKAYFIE